METILTIQDVDRTSNKIISNDNTESNWVAPDGPLHFAEFNLDLLDIPDGDADWRLTHRNIMIRN